MTTSISLSINRAADTVAKKYVELENNPSKNKSVQESVAAYNFKVISFNTATVLTVGVVALAIFTAISFQTALVLGGLFFLARCLIHKEIKEAHPPRVNLFSTLGILPVKSQPWSPDFIKISGLSFLKNLIQEKDFVEKKPRNGGGFGGAGDSNESDKVTGAKKSSVGNSFGFSREESEESDEEIPILRTSAKAYAVASSADRQLNAVSLRESDLTSERVYAAAPSMMEGASSVVASLRLASPRSASHSSVDSWSVVGRSSPS